MLLARNGKHAAIPQPRSFGHNLFHSWATGKRYRRRKHRLMIVAPQSGAAHVSPRMTLVVTPWQPPAKVSARLPPESTGHPEYAAGTWHSASSFAVAHPNHTLDQIEHMCYVAAYELHLSHVDGGLRLLRFIRFARLARVATAPVPRCPILNRRKKSTGTSAPPVPFKPLVIEHYMAYKLVRMGLLAGGEQAQARG